MLRCYDAAKEHKGACMEAERSGWSCNHAAMRSVLRFNHRNVLG
jgi:hypothetical protein